MDKCRFLSKINKAETLLMTEYMHWGGWSALADMASQIEPEIQPEAKNYENQAYAALRLSLMLESPALDVTCQNFFDLAWRKHLYDLVINDLAFKINQRAAGQSFDLSGKFCPIPFEQMVIFDDFQYAVPCVESGRHMGRLADMQNPLDLWLSPMAETLRKSILDGTFAFCRKNICGLGGKMAELGASGVNKVVTDCYKGPKILYMYHDTSCNIRCGFCREEIFERPQARQDEYMALFNKYAAPFKDTVEIVRLKGSGEPFASPSYLYMMKEISNWPNLKTVDISSNGLLIDFDLLNHLHGLLEFSIGFDSNIKETYEAIRRGGEFRRFKANIEELARRRKSGQVKRLHFMFMVLPSNFREIPDIIKLVNDLGVDSIEFRMMMDTRGMSPEEVTRTCVWRPGHPDEPEFSRIRHNPNFNGPNIKWVG